MTQDYKYGTHSVKIKHTSNNEQDKLPKYYTVVNSLNNNNNITNNFQVIANKINNKQ